jgi:hypothetical protein
MIAAYWRQARTGERRSGIMPAILGAEIYSSLNRPEAEKGECAQCQNHGYGGYYNR